MSSLSAQIPRISDTNPSNFNQQVETVAVTTAERYLASLQRLFRWFNPWLLLLVPAYYMATALVLKGRYPITHSFAPNVIWGYEWTEQFRSGIWYPRWTDHTFLGLGSPTFHFYAPLAFFVMLVFTVGLKMSVTSAVLAVTKLALCVMGLGVARLTSVACSPRRRWVSGVTGALSMVVPYALIDAYARGAIAEIWAMAICPWLLAALLTSLERRDPLARFGLVIATALMGLAHPALFVATIIAVGTGLLVVADSWQSVWDRVRRVGVPMAAGIMLDSFYLMSAVFDQKYVSVNRINDDISESPTHRLLAKELSHLSTKLADGFEGDLTPGFVAGLLAITLAAVFLWRRGHPSGPTHRRSVVFLLTIAALAALMMTDLSRGVYSLLPVLNRLQFSWRWLTIFSTVTATIWGYVLLVAVEQHARGRGLLRVVVWMATIWMATQSLASIEPLLDFEQRPRHQVDALFEKMKRTGVMGDPTASPKEVNGGLLHVDERGDLISLDVDEYLPADRIRNMPPRRFPLVEWATGIGNVSEVSWRYQVRQFRVDSVAGGRVLVRTNAWPGWEVRVNDVVQLSGIHGDSGRIVAIVPAGRSQVSVRYIGTTSQHVGEVISVLTLLVLAGSYLWMKRVGTVRLDWGI